MTLAKELAKKRQNVLEESALTVALNVKEKLHEVAEIGGSDYCVLVTEKNNYATSNEYIEMLSELLDGVQIEVVTKSMFLSTITYLKFSW